MLRKLPEIQERKVLFERDKGKIAVAFKLNRDFARAGGMAPDLLAILLDDNHVALIGRIHRDASKSAMSVKCSGSEYGQPKRPKQNVRAVVWEIVFKDKLRRGESVKFKFVLTED